MNHDASENNITVFGDLLQLPQEEVKQCDLYQRVLKLNFHATGEARFALAGESLVVCFSRPTLGMDYHEFQHAVAAVAQVANDFDEELAEEFSDVYVPDEEDLREG